MSLVQDLGLLQIVKDYLDFAGGYGFMSSWNVRKTRKDEENENPWRLRYSMDLSYERNYFSKRYPRYRVDTSTAI